MVKRRVTREKPSRYIGIRLPPSLFSELEQSADENHMLVSEFVRERLAQIADLEKTIKQLQTEVSKWQNTCQLYKVEYTCSICGTPMVVTSGEEKRAVRQYMAEHQWSHQECAKKRTP